MIVASLISGGKDSIYAAYLEKKKGSKISFLLGMIPENKESYMFHSYNLHILETISKLSGIKLITEKTKGIKEEELKDLKNLISKVKGKADAITTGAVESEYQKSRIEKICKEMGIKLISPLWHKDPTSMLKDMLDSGFEIMIISVAAPPLDEKWLGRKIDYKCIEELCEMKSKYGIHIMGEGGEYDTLVTKCPLYNGKKIEIEESEKKWDIKTRSGYLEIKKISVIND